MRVLVTGGAGFIGSHVTDALLISGHETAVLDNLSTGSRNNLHPKAIFYHVDVTDAERVDQVFREFRPDVVVHHAAQVDVRVSVQRPVFDAEVNTLGALNLLTSAVAAGTRKIIYASSGGAVYGEPEQLPVREDHRVRPISPYGISKYAVEHYLSLYSQNHGLGYTVLRYANVYGPRQNPYGEGGVIAIFTNRLLEGKPCTIYGDGGQTRDYVYVSDIVAANLRALEHGDGLTVNIGSGRGTSVTQIYRSLQEIMGTSREPVYAPERVGEIRHSYLDGSLAKATLGWACSVSLDEGLRRTVAWQSELRVMQESAAAREVSPQQ